MSLRALPEIKAQKLPEVCAFQPDDDALARWDAGVVAKDSNATISILDVIGENWDGSGITARRVSAALRSIGDQAVTVDINSPGGDFFEGVAIYNLLREHPAKVTVRVLGLAASAASVIAMAGDEVQIGKAGFIMVHNAWVLAIGNRHDLVDAAKTMELFDAAMAALYAERAGVDEKQAARWMDDETWFGGDAAMDAGLADALLPGGSTKNDDTKAALAAEVRATHRIDVAMAKSGLPRSERRALLAEVKGGTRDAAPTVTHDAGELAALAKGLFK